MQLGSSLDSAVDLHVIYNTPRYSCTQERGARNALLLLTEEEKKAGVMAASAGWANDRKCLRSHCYTAVIHIDVLALYVSLAHGGMDPVLHTLEKY